MMETIKRIDENRVEINGKIFELKEVEKPNRFDVNMGEYYHTETGDGDICILKNRELSIDNKAKENFNAYRYEKDAKNFAKIQKLQRMLLQFSIENGIDKIDWNSGFTNKKYYIYFNNNSKAYQVDNCSVYQDLTTVYFSTYEIAQQAFEKFKDILEEVRQLDWTI